MRRLVAATVLIASLGAVSSGPPASAAPAQAACARLSLAFVPGQVEPGQFMDFDTIIENCSSMTELLAVSLVPSPRCDFMRRSIETWELGPNQGVGSSALMTAPSCPGRYRVNGRVSFRGEPLDTASAWFVVRPGR